MNQSGWKGRLSSALVAGTFLTAAFVSGPSNAETLEEAFISAYTSNPTLLAERVGVKATSEVVRQAKSGWLPNVTVQGSVGRQKVTSYPGGAEATNDPKTAAASVTQPVFRGGQTVYSTRSAEAQTRAAKASLVAVEQQVFFSTAQSYFDVLRDTAVVELSRNNVQVLERQLQAAQDRFRVGEITRTDVAQAEARLSGSRSRLTQSEAALAASRSAYERIVGNAPTNMGSIEEQPRVTELPASEEEAVNVGLLANPFLRAAREREMASRQNIKAIRGALLPQVSLNTTFSYAEDQGSFFDESDTLSISGQVTIPLYQGGANYSRIRQAKQTNSQNRIQIAETERSVRENVINAWEGLKSARATIQSSEQQVRANEIAFNGVRQEAQVGSRTTLDVLNAEQELLDARVTLVRARRDEQVATYALLSSMGRLTAEHLGLPVDLYRP